MPLHRLTLPLAALLLIACDRSAAPQESDPPPATESTRQVADARYTDADARQAAEALAAGHPWRASRALVPVLRDSARRTPAVVLLAATAAGQWGGWRLVDSLLAGAPWADTVAGGAALELRARAALARDANDSASVHAAAAARAAGDDRVRGERLVLLARALDRLEQRDSARATYAAAAALLPDIADWLLLRAAGVT
ncbi:MAG TPA: hypothetical protein VFS05_16780, partial [Gemmatimonadaceae bacterium]|nr:hypothetical protein [Gemmatimonadaceae bacterium]